MEHGTRPGYDSMSELALIALVGVVFASIIVPTTTIAMLKANPSNGHT